MWKIKYMQSPFVSILYLDQITLKFQNWYFNDKILKITWISIKNNLCTFEIQETVFEHQRLSGRLESAS